MQNQFFNISFVESMCVCLFAVIAELHTVGSSQSSLIQLMGPSDCILHDHVRGGESTCFSFLDLALSWLFGGLAVFF